MPIRELVARLLFKADVTEAQRFESTIKNVKGGIESLNKVRLGGLNTMLGKFFTAVSIFAGGLKTVFKFSDVQQAINELEFRLRDQGGFDILRDDIEGILQDDLIGNLVHELDLLNASATEVGKGLDPKVLEDLLRPATLFAINSRKSITEILSGISSFISDANLDILVQAGKLDQAQIELLKRAGTGPGQEGIIARTERIREVFFSITGDLESQTKKLVDTGAVSSKELAGAFDKLVLEIGERTTPAFKEMNDVLIPFIEDLTKLARGEVKIKDVAAKTIKEAEIQPKLISGALTEFPNLFKSLFEFSRSATPSLDRANQAIQIINEQQRGQVLPDPEPTPGQAATIGGKIEVNNNITIMPGAQVDETALLSTLELANRRAWGNISDQAKRTTIRRGG
jgi:hypothetical protein